MRSINNIELAAAAFYYRQKNKNFDGYVSYRTLREYGENIVAILKKRGIDDVCIDQGRNLTNNLLNENRKLFEEYDCGILARKSLKEMEGDLVHLFVYFPYYIVGAFGEEKALEPVLRK